MYEYYTALREGTGGAQPEHAPQVEKARRDQQARGKSFLSLLFIAGCCVFSVMGPR